MKTKSLLFMLMCSTLLFVFFNACKKEDTKNDNPEQVSSANNNAMAEAIFSETKTIGDQASTGSLSTFIPETQTTLLSSCATISLDTTSTPHKIIIYFGTTNCLCGDGNYRRGKINISFTGHYRDSATVITFTFDNYAENDNLVDNSTTKTITNKGRNSSGHYNYTIAVNAKIYPVNGGSFTWISTRNNEWIAGYNTPFIWLDDVYLITGSSSGVGTNGKAYSMTISNSNPLRVQLNCAWITKGSITMVEGLISLLLDYGTGACDRIATVTLFGNTYQITL